MTTAALLGGFGAGWDAASMFFVFPDIRDGIGGGASRSSWQEGPSSPSSTSTCER